MDSPLISCLCVTHNKPKILTCAIKCFERQTYENKQLIIVYDESDIEKTSFLKKERFCGNIKIVPVNLLEQKNNIGILRNISIRESDGEYICIWDDDDWYDIDRLEIQFQQIRMSKKKGSVLSRIIIYNSLNNKSYLSYPRLWEGTLVCTHELMISNPYPELKIHEDTPIIKKLYSIDVLTIINNHPELYIYNYHANNTCNKKHFDLIFENSIELNIDYCKRG